MNICSHVVQPLGLSGGGWRGGDGVCGGGKVVCVCRGEVTCMCVEARWDVCMEER